MGVGGELYVNPDTVTLGSNAVLVVLAGTAVIEAEAIVAQSPLASDTVLRKGVVPPQMKQGNNAWSGNNASWGVRLGALLKIIAHAPRFSARLSSEHMCKHHLALDHSASRARH